MSNTNKYSPKSILKKGASSHNHNTSNSWFSKFNNASNDSSRINSLFSGFRSSTSRLNGEDDNLSSELMPREIRRVRFPIHDMTTEYKFNQDETIDLNKSTLQQPTKPISIKTSSQLLSLYETICRNKQEPTIDSFVTTLITHSQATFLNRLDLTNQPIDRHTISPLADVLCIDFGIKELILNNCRLEDDAIKILMHSLLQNDRINQLELANNSKLTTIAFKYIAVYIKGVRREYVKKNK
ncbi:uncharacterized protein BX663DRAFT_429195 [Cokeromyces recurvatus]|uniref:uncharacterized protein n=1 Tax=Cokeromyces recurvatus TaxID=90255 RepID=UPI00221FC7F0|nr:uncharacterized protein BX663DRAFT_429195 [Cokeromyces recurvatus]KAI7905585.1 hypothetical protein BX663DRAFT_429195 [Cokeromyces recurvatus]